MVPNGWSQASLDKIAKVIDCKHRTPIYVEDGIPLISPGTIKWGPIDLDSPSKRVTPEEHESLMDHCKVQVGDLVMSRNQSVGVASYINTNRPFVLGQDTVLIQPIKTDPKFLFYSLQSLGTQKRILKLAGGSTFSRINLADIRKIQVSFPKQQEQQKIAQILSTWDKAIEKLEALIAAKQKRKKALMQQLLTGKQRFAGFDGEWKTYKLSDIADKKKKWSFTGGPFGSNLKAQDYKESGVRIIQLQNIGDGQFLDSYKIYTSDEKANELLSCNIYPGEIIISKMGDPVARACFIPNSAERFLMASDGIRLAVDEEKFNKKFIHDYINYKIFRKTAIEVSTGSTRQRIGLDDLRKLTLFAPSILEQQKIAAVLSAADTEIQTHQKHLSALKEQKKGLMQQLLTGKKRVKVDGHTPCSHAPAREHRPAFDGEVCIPTQERGNEVVGHV